MPFSGLPLSLAPARAPRAQVWGEPDAVAEGLVFEPPKSDAAKAAANPFDGAVLPPEVFDFFVSVDVHECTTVSRISPLHGVFSAVLLLARVAAGTSLWHQAVLSPAPWSDRSSLPSCPRRTRPCRPRARALALCQVERSEHYQAVQYDGGNNAWGISKGVYTLKQGRARRLLIKLAQGQAQK